MGNINTKFHPSSNVAIDFNEASDVAIRLNPSADIAINIPSDIAGGFGAEYQAVYDSYTTKPDDATAAIWNTFVESIVASGEWALLDVLYVYAAHTNGAGEALKNWINPGTFDATAFNAPDFVANQGFSGNGSTRFINWNWNPNTNGVNYVLNSASDGVYIRTNVNESAIDIGAAVSGTDYSFYIVSRLSNGVFFRVNTDTDFSTAANTDSRGMFIGSREASNIIRTYKNKVQLTDESDASVAVPSLDIYSLARNNDDTADIFSTKQLSMVYAGDKFTQTNVNNFTDAFEVAMDALSTGVIP